MLMSVIVHRPSLSRILPGGISADELRQAAFLAGVEMHVCEQLISLRLMQHLIRQINALFAWVLACA